MEECSDKKIVDLAVNVSSSMNFKENFDRKLIEYDQQHQGSHRKAWTSERILQVINEIKKAQVTMNSGKRRTAMEYYWMSKYDVMTTGNEDCLIFKRLTPSAATVRILPREQYYDVLSEIHKSCGHGGRDKTLCDLKNRYYIPKKAVEIFVSNCPVCENKRSAPKKSNVMKSIVSPGLNLRGQVDLIDFQSCPDGEFKWLLHYQDNTTKFVNLCPLKTKTTVEVATELMKVFLIFGAPYILQSDNGREFTADVIKELVAMWPECKIVHGNPCHSETDSIEKSCQDVEKLLRAWMKKNKSTNWSLGCCFVQYSKNSKFHQTIGKSPYNALFGSEPKAGLNGSDIPTSILSTLETEEQLKMFAEREPAEATSSDNDNNDNNLKTEMENIEHSESILTCAACHKETTGVHKCRIVIRTALETKKPKRDSSMSSVSSDGRSRDGREARDSHKQIKTERLTTPEREMEYNKTTAAGMYSMPYGFGYPFCPPSYAYPPQTSMYYPVRGQYYAPPGEYVRRPRARGRGRGRGPRMPYFDGPDANQQYYRYFKKLTEHNPHSEHEDRTRGRSHSRSRSRSPSHSRSRRREHSRSRSRRRSYTRSRSRRSRSRRSRSRSRRTRTRSRSRRSRSYHSRSRSRSRSHRRSRSRRSRSRSQQSRRSPSRSQSRRTPPASAPPTSAPPRASPDSHKVVTPTDKRRSRSWSQIKDPPASGSPKDNN